MPEHTYSRGESEWALSRLFEEIDGPDMLVGGVTLATRVKRLLDVDRIYDLPNALLAAGALFAFNTRAAEGKGGQSLFTVLDIFCLSVALRLLRLGFKQQEVVAHIRLVRVELARILRATLKIRPKLALNLSLEKDSYGRPLFKGGHDYRSFLVLRRIEIEKEAQHNLTAIGLHGFAPGKLSIVLEGRDALFDFLEARRRCLDRYRWKF